ncbi:hypothetical protein [Bacillus cereus]|uniref:hypothetical protein n=1 Tax=Bacillus cereus TaxID=1396 RepID=UPI000B4AA841|nr:hypothetical protein [Bacillus cereus]
MITNYHLQVEGMDEHLSLCDEILILEEELEVWGEEMYGSWAETNKPTSVREITICKFNNDIAAFTGYSFLFLENSNSLTELMN